MKKIVLLALAASTAIASPALAADPSVTGTVIINGHVDPKCTVVNGASTSQTFGTTVDMGELSQANGTLQSSATLSSTFNTVGGTGLSAKVICTTAAPKIAVDADPVVSATAATAGYTNTVNFQADVTTKESAHADELFSNDSAAAAGSATALAARLNSTQTNVIIATSNWRTTAGAILVAATDYTGKIVVTITPN